MADLTLSLAIAPYDRVMPLITGEAKPEGLTLEYARVPGPDIFYRQLKFHQFDVSEMSFSLIPCFLVYFGQFWWPSRF